MTWQVGLVLALAGVFVVAELALLISGWRALRRARKAGETRIHALPLELVWLALPGLAVAGLFVLSFLQRGG